ncbi:MAG: metal-dependent hydrolase [Pseudomonadota bacterium]|nr:metal-dependent hydrolase [Pseudomonadota bacterium]
MNTTTASLNDAKTTDESLGKPVVRQMEFGFSDDLPRYMYRNNPMISGLVYALSESFPQGEEMFIESVRNFQDKITDPELKKEVRAFIGQEAHHGKQHREFNEITKKRGFPVDRYYIYHEWLIKNSSRVYGKKGQLALTVGFEHITASFGSEFLRNDKLREEVDERVNRLMIWHAIEEIEHKTVAFDVYQQCVGSNWLRYRTFVMGTISYLGFLTYATVAYAISEKQFFNWSAWKEFFQFMYSKDIGVMRRLFKDMGKYFSKDFSPRNDDHSALLEEWMPYVNESVTKKP